MERSYLWILWAEPSLRPFGQNQWKAETVNASAFTDERHLKLQHDLRALALEATDTPVRKHRATWIHLGGLPRPVLLGSELEPATPPLGLPPPLTWW